MKALKGVEVQLQKLATWKRKILRKTVGTVKENGVWRIRTNHELMNQYRETGIILEIRKVRSR